jgi:ABC-type phosphate/phosphonate transport system substrate-binding protein
MPERTKRIARAALVLSTVFAVQTATADLVLSAPPRETPEAGLTTYGLLAEFLSKAIGEKVEYRYPDTWGIYQALMTKGDYDLVFDGPHFVSWRIQRLQHVPLAALSGKLSFVVVALQTDTHVHAVKDLVGKKVCGHAPPNLATLTLYDQFPNPSRQPRLVETKGFDGAYQGLLAGKCVGTVLPLEVHKKLDGTAARTKVLYTSEPFTNQALTAGPRVSAEIRQKIAKALLGAEGRMASRQIAATFGGSEFVAVSKDDYAGYDGLLKNTWGFELRH